MNYKKIIMSLSTIAFVMALVVGGTGAFFNDTETSTGNTFTAGELDLTIDNSSYGFDWNRPNAVEPIGDWGLNDANSWALDDLTGQLFFQFEDLKPGDYGEDTISLHVQNDAWACMAFDLTATPENDWNEPEQDAGDPGTQDGDDGELQNYLSFLFWNDDGDNVYEDDETIIEELSGLPGSIFSGEWLAITEGGDSPLAAGETTYIGKGWCFGDIAPAPVAQDGVNTGAPTADNTGFSCTGAEGDHNDAQTDGIEVDVSFYAVQSRNNDDFLCADLPPIGGGEPDDRPLVGAVAFAYSEPDPQVCDLTVDPTATPDAVTFNTVTAAEAAATDGQVICVDSGTYNEDVVIDVPNLSVLGLNDPKGVDKATIDGRIDIDVNGVTISGLEITNPDSSFGIVIDGVDSTEISFNSFTTIGTTILGSAQAIYYDGGAGAASGLSIHDNMIDTIGSVTLEPGGDGTSAKGIFIGDSTSPAALSGVVIEDNMISNIVASSDAFGDGGRGAYGILINYGVGSTGSVPGAIIRNNTIETLAGWWAHAVGLETDTAGALVTLNAISDLVGASGDSDGVFFEGNPNSDVLVNVNNFAPGVPFGVAIHPSNPAISVNAEDNWWGDLDPSDNVVESSGTIDFDPFEASTYPEN